MRRWFVLLMVLLLPLRAVAGDAMSVGMALAEQAPAVASGMAPGCLMHMASASEAPTTDDAPAPMSVAECGSCALCFPVAQVDTVAVADSSRLADARPAPGDDRYLSATALGLLRPPKS